MCIYQGDQRDPAFCRRYPTGPCVGGNPEVRSVRDTVASVEPTGDQAARGGRDCQPRGGREPGLKGKANSGESLSSRRY
jgi:hypothetical protein